MEELATVAAKTGGDDRVRVRWSVDEERAHLVDKQAIREMFHVEHLKLEGTVNPIVSVRSPGIGKVQKLENRLRLWLDTTGDNEKGDKLVEMLRELEEEK